MRRSMSLPHIIFGCCLLLPLRLLAEAPATAEFDTFMQPLFAGHCTKCHGEKKVKGKVNLVEVKTVEQLLAKPDLINDMIEVIEARDMPPEDEPQPEDPERARLLAGLRTMLRESVSAGEVTPAPLRRLNRFQYNYAVRDLFQMNRDIFALPEKLMTRQGNHLKPADGRMPDQVAVSCQSLRTTGSLAEVRAFPKDLRAAHGFDNQANQLTLSPLLLDTFLKLSLSILNSADFNRETVGIWNEFFGEPTAGTDPEQEVRTRLEGFLTRAFRAVIDPETLDRYTAYTLSRMRQGASFTEGMKKAASAILSSPRFLFRPGETSDGEDLFVIASNLSFFLWGSIPDEELLRLAASGELARPAVFDQTVTRMLKDPKIERFLDSFPAQWMQLENVLAATPDPKLARLFSLDQENPASLQMVLEPLLLFDAVFVEDRPITELIAPAFAYQSEFLKDWYTSDLSPPQVDPEQLAAENRAKDEQRASLQEAIKTTRAELESLVESTRFAILAARKKDPGTSKPPDLKPIAAWEFNGDLKDSIGSLDLQAHGGIRYEDGMVVLDKAYLQSAMLPIELKAKTLEVWCKVHDPNQSGGGLMGIHGPGEVFDVIVLGERKPQHWISGSNGFARTEDFRNSTPETKPGHELHLIMVYRADGTTTLYRNGEPYGKPFRKDAMTFPANQSFLLFGLRHLPPGGNKYLTVSLGRARLYDRALEPGEVAASGSGDDYVTGDDLLRAMSPGTRERQEALRRTLEQSEAALKKVPKNQDLKNARRDTERRFDDEMRKKMRSPTFDRVAASDPRYGGVITNAAMLSMTSGPTRTHPIARGAWVIEVIFNDPPAPPPNNVPPLNEEDESVKNLTIREKFAQHRENPDCAGCHSRLDPLGFALENFDITGRWRDQYDNGRKVDPSGTLMKKYEFDGIVRFKEAILREDRRFAKAFTAHLLRFALSRELGPADSLTVEAIVDKAEKDGFKLQSLIREVIRSDGFIHSK